MTMKHTKAVSGPTPLPWSLALVTFLVTLQVQLPGPADAAVALALVDANPEYPGQCFLEETGDVFSVGASITLSDPVCTRASCYESGSEEKYLVEFAGCGVMSVEGGLCTLKPVQEGVPYPQCCQYECPEVPNEPSPATKEVYVPSRFNKLPKVHEKIGRQKGGPKPNKLLLL